VASIRIFPFTYLSEVEGLNTLLQQAIDKDPVRGLDLDCFWLSVSLPVGQIFAIFFISLAISPLFSWLLAVLQEVVLLLFHLFLSVLYMAYAARR
jgi:ABC-type transport system involved in cytochrome bd biosynthesis fused ATPase/permease subunit